MFDSVTNSETCPMKPEMICIFAVFFNRPELLTPVDFPRQKIVDFISRGRYFAKEPRYKPSAKSPEMRESHWFTLDVFFDSTSSIQVRWADWNHVFPYSVEPLKNMVQGMANDALESDLGGLVQFVANSTDAIWVHASETELTDGCRRMLDGLRAFLLEKLQGVLFVPGKGLDGNDSKVNFPDDVQHPQNTLIFGNAAKFGKNVGNYGIAISPDGKTIATVGDAGKKAGLWDAETGELKKVLVGHKQVTRSVAFSPDGRTVATGSEDKSAILWDAETGRTKKVLLGHWGIIGAVAFSPDGQLLATAGYDGTTILWNPTDGTKVATVQAHGRQVMALKEEGEKWYSWKNTPGCVCSVAFSPGGNLLATGGTDFTIRICAVASGELLQTFEGYVWPVIFSPDGKLLAAGSDGKLRLWQVTAGKVTTPVKFDADFGHALAFSPDGKTLAIGSSDTIIRLWDISRKKRVFACYGHLGAVSSVAFLPDGKRLVSAGDGTVRVWQLE